ncbi:MAG TPA: glutathione S-transferase family protein [Thermoanaerobaculia bacterium]|nr:glutathione S-transferase family protein [Thermoanaerobaculia bacterium]
MLILWEHPLSPYAQKNKIALREKGLQFEARTPLGIGTGSALAEFERVSPLREVPALVDGDFSLFDSRLILEYLEDSYPEPPLLPRDPRERARARGVEVVMDRHYEPLNWALSELRYFKRASGDLGQRLEAAAATDARRLQGWLEETLGDRTWFGGERFGWADLAVVPYLNGSRGFGLAPAPGSPLLAWLERANERPTVAATAAEAAAAAASMAGVADLVSSGRFKRQYRDHRLEWMVRSGGLEVIAEGLRRDNIRFNRFP